MHKVIVEYTETEYKHNAYYKVEVYCDLVRNYRWMGRFPNVTDAVKFANWKAIELGVEVELGYGVEKALSTIKENKKEKKEKK